MLLATVRRPYSRMHRALDPTTELTQPVSPFGKTEK
jgi:hypothetical protein